MSALETRRTQASEEVAAAPKDDAVAAALALRTNAGEQFNTATTAFDAAVQATARARKSHDEFAMSFIS